MSDQIWFSLKEKKPEGRGRYVVKYNDREFECTYYPWSNKFWLQTSSVNKALESDKLKWRDLNKYEMPWKLKDDLSIG